LLQQPFFICAMMKKITLFSVIYFACTLLLSAQNINRISVHMKSEALKEGKKFEHEADIYYSPQNGKYVSHHYQPKEFIKITNRTGEMKLYFPEENTVSTQQNSLFSSENEMLHYFVNNLTEDLGLRKEGFRLHETKNEEPYEIMIWKAPPTLKMVDEVKIVFKDMMPVFSSYKDGAGNTIRKIYYTGYQHFSQFILPQRITEITYTSAQDSTIRRTHYKDIKMNEDVNPYYLEFKIPEDATSIK